MSVQIVINGENANEAIQELAALSAGITGQTAPIKNKTVAAVEETPKKADRMTRVKSEPEKTPTVNQSEPEDNEPTINEPTVDDGEDSYEPIPTDAELRELARNVGAQGPEAKAAIKELLKKYGVPNITAVPAEKRLAFKRELEALA